jgi:hypothetical protein
MPNGQLDGARVFLDVWREDRLSSILKLGKLVRKGKTTESALLKIAQEKHPTVTDWRAMNWGELRMMTAFVTGDTRVESDDF